MSRINVRIGLSAILTLLVLASLPAAALAQDWGGRGRVQGMVTDEKGEPIEGAVIRLYQAGTKNGPDPIETNKKGRWSYLGLGTGAWTVEIEVPGYAISEGTFPVSELTPNDPIMVQLEPAAAVAASQGDGQAAAAQAAAEEATKTLAEAGRLIEAGQLAEGRALLDQAMEQLDPAKHPAILLSKAKTHFQEGNVADTIATLEQGLAIDPDHVDSLKLISSILINEGRSDEAEAYRARLPAGQKIDPNALLNQGISLYNGGSLDEALAAFDQIVAEYPNLPDAYYYRGLTRLGKAQNAEALADFEKMLELDPSHANAEEARQFVEYLKSQ